MVNNFLKSIFKNVFSIFSSSSVEEEREKEKILENCLSLMRELISDHREEREFFRQWLMGFQNPGSPPDRDVDAEIKADLVREAALGNTFARDIVASDEVMADYIKTIKEAY